MSTRKIATTAVMSALATILMFLEIPLFFMPAFLKFDFSEIPIMIVAFSVGPWYGVIAELIKNLLHLTVTQSAGIGELSNFVIGAVYVLSAGYIYKTHKTRKGAAWSMVFATLIIAAVAAPFNYFTMLPLYAKVYGMNTEAIIAMCREVNKLINTKLDVILWVFVPFNLFKGAVASIITFVIYKPISKFINKKR
ncbi:MAG: ECF transporter S component [Clostridia bacterium]|nr:ECF transporter S component [Clostridia bacterium]